MQKVNHFTMLEYSALKLLNNNQKVNSIIGVRDKQKDFDELWPISVELHLTNVCNLKCCWCTDKNLRKNKNSLDQKIIKDLFCEFKTHGAGVTIEGGGEPCLHRDFEGIVQDARDIGVDIGLITNGTVDIGGIANHFKWIRVSLDATNSTEYVHEKGVDRFKDVLRNIRTINDRRNKADTLLGIGFVITKNNNRNLLAFTKLLDKLGVNYIYMRPVEDAPERLPDFDSLYAFNKNLIKHEERLRVKVILKIDERAVKNNAGLPCICHSLSCIIRADGDVVICEKRRHDIKVLGNICNESFENIWLSERRKKISQQLLQSEYQQGCGVCRITSYNQMFYNLLKLKTSKFI